MNNREMDMKNELPLVSIISPCFNGEKYITKMLESILNQEYGNIELICVDDGSTDGTGEIINSYINRFNDKGKVLIYIYQDNMGQAAALNTGLKYIKGEYLCWIDCDDYIMPDSIRKKVDFLRQNPEYDAVTTDIFVIEQEKIDNCDNIYDQNYLESNADTRAKYLGHLNYQKNQFYLLLTGKSVMECHAHMISVSALRQINPDLEISKCRAGQNYQMLLPFFYKYKRGFINEPLAVYVIRKNSHYHSKRNKTQEINRLNELINMLEEIFTFLNIPDWQKNKYIKMSAFYREKVRIMDNVRS